MQSSVREDGACRTAESRSMASGWIISMIWISSVRESDFRHMDRRDPLVEYKMLGYDMFDEMTAAIQEDTIRILYHVQDGTEGRA